MTRPTTVLVVIAGLLTTTELAHAQPATPEAFRQEGVLSGVLLQPLGDFHRALQTIPIGGGFHYLRAIGSGPVGVGVDSEFLFYDDSPKIYYRGEAPEMIGTVHGLVRVRQRVGPRRLYAEAVGGIKQFSWEAATRIGTFSYGVGAGMQLPLGRSTSAGAPEQQVIEIGVRYFRGVDYQKFASSTHSVTLHVGAGFQF